MNKTIKVSLGKDGPKNLTISKVDATQFRASLLDGFSKYGHVYHIKEAKGKEYYEEIKNFLSC